MTSFPPLHTYAFSFTTFATSLLHSTRDHCRPCHCTRTSRLPSTQTVHLPSSLYTHLSLLITTPVFIFLSSTHLNLYSVPPLHLCLLPFTFLHALPSSPSTRILLFHLAIPIYLPVSLTCATSLPTHFPFPFSSSYIFLPSLPKHAPLLLLLLLLTFTPSLTFLSLLPHLQYPLPFSPHTHPSPPQSRISHHLSTLLLPPYTHPSPPPTSTASKGTSQATLPNTTQGRARQGRLLTLGWLYRVATWLQMLSHPSYSVIEAQRGLGL